jgi:hypothetical protein
MSKMLNIFSATAVVSMLLAVAACNKPDEIELPTEGHVYMPQANVEARRKLTIDLTDFEQTNTLAYGASYGGLNVQKKDVSVKFRVDPSQVAAYNAQNGTNYVLLPSNYYSFTTDAVIPAGQVSTAPLDLVVKTAYIPFSGNQPYIVPLAIESVSTGGINTSLATTFFTLDTLVQKPDFTNDGVTLTVDKENRGGASAGEGSLKVIDNNVSSKFLIFFSDYGSGPYSNFIQLRYQRGQKAVRYTLTSGGDAPNRDPKNWVLEASNNGADWTTLDSRSNEVFASRGLTQSYTIAPASQGKYTFYRLRITDYFGGNGVPNQLFQLAEFRLFKM